MDICCKNKIEVVSLKMVKHKNIYYKNKRIDKPTDAVELIRNFIGDMDREAMIVCCLNVKNEINYMSVIALGTLNSILIHPREVYKIAILTNSNSIILSHIHPSGDTKPSKEDINITKRLKEAGDILRIELLDHLIIGDNNYLSLKEECYI